MGKLIITEKDLKSYIVESYYGFTSKSINVDALITSIEELKSVVQLEESRILSVSEHQAKYSIV